MNAEILILRLIHILGGIFWVGSMLFVVFFLQPTLAKIGSAASQVMAGLRKRRQLTILPTVGLVTILSGLWLMWITSGGFSMSYFVSLHGLLLVVGAISTVIALSLGFFVVRPATLRAGHLMNEMGTNAAAKEALQRIRRMNERVNLFVVSLLILASGTMAIARYTY